MQKNVILATYRTKNSLTQQEMADILNVSLSNYKLYESGILPMSLEVLNVFSNYFNISLDYLLGLSENPFTSNFRKTIDYKYLRFCIVLLRKRSRITQKDLAKELNISAYTISKYEKDGKKVSIYYLYNMAKKYQLSADYICGKSMNKEIL